MTFKFFKNSKCNWNAVGIKKILLWALVSRVAHTRVVRKKCNIRYLFILTSCFSLITFSANAEKTDIPCANNTGIIVKGNIEGDYCLGNAWVDYWNAVSWCDGIGMQLADITDCICTISTDCSNKKCPNFVGMFNTSGWWLNTPSSETNQWHLNTTDGHHLISWPRTFKASPLCKNK